MYLIKMKGEFIVNEYSNRENIAVSVVVTRRVSEEYNPHYTRIDVCLTVTKLKDGTLGVYIKNVDYKKNEELLKKYFTIDDDNKLYLFNDSGEVPIFLVTEVEDVVKVASKEGPQNITSSVMVGIDEPQSSSVMLYTVKIVNDDPAKIDYLFTKIISNVGIAFEHNTCDLYISGIYGKDGDIYLSFYTEVKNDVFADDVSNVLVTDNSELNHLSCKVINSTYINKSKVINAFSLIDMLTEDSHETCSFNVALSSTTHINTGNKVYLDLNDTHYHPDEQPPVGHGNETIEVVVPKSIVKNIIRSFLANGFVIGHTNDVEVLVRAMYQKGVGLPTNRYIHLDDAGSFENTNQPNARFQSRRDTGFRGRSFDDTVMIGHRHGSRSGDRIMSFHRGGRSRSNVGDNQYHTDVLSRYGNVKESIDKINQLKSMVDQRISSLMSDLTIVDSRMTTPTICESTIGALEEELNHIVVCLEDALR